MTRARGQFWLVLLLGILAPGAVVFSYVHTFGVNVPVHDEWHFMPAIESFYAGHQWPRELIDHYGEHRIPVAKAVILAMAPFTKYNVKAEMYVSALLMVLGAFVCFRLLLRTHASPWLMIPIGWLYISTAQFENLLVGWQIVIPLMSFFALLTVLLLSQEPLRPWHQLAAAVTALCSTFSFANGPLIWPVLVFLVAARTRSKRVVAFWVVLAITAFYLYSAGYSGFHRRPGDQAPDYAGVLLHTPHHVAALFLASIGNNFSAGDAMTGVLAGVITAAAALLLALGWKRWVRNSDLMVSPWLALLLFSILSAAAIAAGRAHAWRQFATPSRYLGTTVFIPIALLVLGAEVVRRAPPRIPSRVVLAAAALLLLTAAWQHTKAVRVGWQIGAANRNQNLNAIPCLIQYRTAPADCLRKLYAFDGNYVRQQARTLERWHLGPFTALPVSDTPAETELAPKPEDVDPQLIEGTLDALDVQPQPDGRVIVKAQGWSLIGRRESPPAVALIIDGVKAGETTLFLPRGDVAAFFNREIPPSGWTIEATVRLGRGNHHVIAVILDRDGKTLGTLPPKELSW